ncbi:MAG: glycosyltransferase [Thermomicrobiaceae bacterium]|nr:glycosyltransferase [Thermomicrobiaceae bacterium]
MLHKVAVGVTPIELYRSLIREDLFERLQRLAATLKGARILQVNATAYGGGVSEILRSLVAIMRGLGLEAEWRVISGSESFFEVTKTLHNGLQGGQVSLTDEAKAVYLRNNERNAKQMTEHYDFIVVHDPQPAALRQFHDPTNGTKWIWRCHIDTSTPNPAVAEFFAPFVEGYDALIFTMPEFVLPALVGRHIHIIRPAIDPLSPKNIDISRDIWSRILAWMGIDLARPLITQVSRFDPWKDPLGVLRVYRMLRREIPGLQLALVGSMALDDPEGWRIYEEVRAEANHDNDILVATNITGVGNVEVNAFQRGSQVVLQKSIREGFGLVVSETLWKSTPIVAGRTGGIPQQMPEGTGGFLVDPTDDAAFADRVHYLLTHPAEARELAESGKEVVRDHFLLPRMVADQLQLLAEVGGLVPHRETVGHPAESQLPASSAAVGAGQREGRSER